MKAVIITSLLDGELDEIIAINDNDMVICADNGYKIAKENSLRVSRVIGDLDSYDGDEIPIELLDRYESEKDQTDTMLCIDYAIENGATEIDIVSSFYGRFDHTYANIQLLKYATNRGVLCAIKSKNNIAYYIKNRDIIIEKAMLGYMKNPYVSVFSYSEQCRGVNIEGAKYNIENFTMDNSFPIGVSNEIYKTVKIGCESGEILVVISAR